MAVRPVFIPTREGEALVDIVNVDFSWSPGLAVSQKQKSIAALHDGYARMSPGAKILEVSSKSPDALGVQLSAFNMGVGSLGGQFISVESLFQSSKVFTDSGTVRGPFRELMRKAPKEARRAEVLKTSGRLTHFSFQPNEAREPVIWPLEPKSAFYDWLYLNALYHSPCKEQVLNYSAFTDIGQLPGLLRGAVVRATPAAIVNSGYSPARCVHRTDRTLHHLQHQRWRSPQYVSFLTNQER